MCERLFQVSPVVLRRSEHASEAEEDSVECTTQSGIAVVVALLATLILSALGMALLVTAGTETLIAGNYRDGAEAFHAADAAFERTLPDLARVPDWTTVLASPDGVVSASSASFGDAALTAVMADGLSLDLRRATNLLNCPQVFPPASTPCTVAQMNYSAGERPWGRNNPQWRLYGRGGLSALKAGTDSPFYVAVWVADDPADADGDPARDGTDPSNPGAGIVQLRSEAFGPGGARRGIEATVGRAGAGVRIISWRLVR
jgi:Tfp pilus assembly protein PilX